MNIYQVILNQNYQNDRLLNKTNAPNFFICFSWHSNGNCENRIEMVDVLIVNDC